MKRSTSMIIISVLGIVIIYLVYSLITGISGPIKFDKESKIRFAAVEPKLDAIRNLQFAYKEVKGTYASSWDSLFYVIDHDSMTIERKLLIPKAKYNAELYGKDPKVADDTIKFEVTFNSRIALKDTLFKDNKYKRETIADIPFSGGQKFYMNAGLIDAGGGRIKVPVFIVTAPNKYLLKGLNTKYFKPDEGYQMGSMYETTTEYLYKREAVEFE
ncbi:MAG: hypothetical protein IPG60_11400 [Bacteroidetes bacterium]|nr:hypothetical protein [Bacteroidota bacterium]